MNKYMLLLVSCIATQAVRANVEITMTDASGEQTVAWLAPQEEGAWRVGTTDVGLVNVEETKDGVSLVIVAQDEASKTEEVAQEETRTVDVEIQEKTVAYGEKVAVLDVTISVEKKEEATEQN